MGLTAKLQLRHEGHHEERKNPTALLRANELKDSLFKIKNETGRALVTDERNGCTHTSVLLKAEFWQEVQGNLSETKVKMLQRVLKSRLFISKEILINNFCYDELYDIVLDCMTFITLLALTANILLNAYIAH